MATLTGKTIGELVNLVNPTSGTLIPVEASGSTYNIDYSVIKTYKVYSALLSQTGTNPPLEYSILENTLNAAITWSRDDVGNYTGTFNVTLPMEKTFILIGNPFSGGNNGYCFASYDSPTTIKVYSAGGPNKISDAADFILEYTPIEIRVYN